MLVFKLITTRQQFLFQISETGFTAESHFFFIANPIPFLHDGFGHISTSTS